jgi:16S rRNA pseudouridine516 synthase
MPDMRMVRLDKYICEQGLATRSEARRMIRDGRVTVDGAPVTQFDAKLDADAAEVAVDGAQTSHSRYHYYMMDKPAGLLTATRDPKAPTVLSLMPPKARRMGVFPVGRLDKDTTGLLLLTDDGDFAHRVISPKSEIRKLYLAQVDGVPDEDDVRAFREGLVLGDGMKCLPAKLEITGTNVCRVTVMEGKYHQVKRMLAARGKKVTALRRLSVGGLELDPALGPGGVRELSENELCIVMKVK